MCYIGETSRSFRIRLKEHGGDIKKETIRSLSLVEHSSKTKHHLCLEDIEIIAKEDHFFKRKFREAIEIINHPNNINRDGGVEVNNSWRPLISLI